MKNMKPTLVISFLLATSCSSTLFLQPKVLARPCGKDMVSKVGCAVDFTNPTSSGCFQPT